MTSFSLETFTSDSWLTKASLSFETPVREISLSSEKTLFIAAVKLFLPAVKIHNKVYKKNSISL